MSGGKRLNKRQLRELQELEALEGASGGSSLKDAGQAGLAHEDDQQSSDEDLAEEPGSRVGGGTGLFAQLGGTDTDQEDGSEEEGKKDITAAPVKAKSKSKKKKKKKPSAATVEQADASGIVDEPITAGDGGAGKAKRKKGKKGTSQAAVPGSHARSKDVSNMSMDEFSALLESQAQISKSTNGIDGVAPTATVTPLGPLSTLRSHLALSAAALDPAVELKRQFGSAAIKAYEAEAGAGTQGSSASSGARARAQAWNPNFKVRNILVQPKDTWPPIARTFTGMSMEIFDVEGRGKIGGWVHSKAYRKAQFQFLQAVQSYEPNHLMGLLRMYPWHIDTLLQLSDVSRHQGDLGQASDFNARALFAFERTSAPIFTSSLTSHLGPPMLNFDRVEDRGFWLASHRNVNFLGRRGTWRTALEWVKLILGLDPTSDHHGMLLWIDFLNIKSRQHAWFLESLQKLEAAVVQEMEENGIPILQAMTPFDDEKALVGEGHGCRGALDWYLGLSYAKALALRAEERETNGADKDALPRSTAALRLAIARHPQLLPSLFDKIGLPMPQDVPSSHALFSFDADGDTMAELLTHIYVARSESLWREPGVGSWLTNTLKDSWPALQSAYESGAWQRPRATSQKARLSVYRHVLVSDLPDALRQTLIGLMPRDITSDSTMLNAFDPLPPQGECATAYDDDYFSTLRSRRSGAADDDDYIDMDGPAAAGVMDRLMQALRGVRGLEGWGAAMEEMDDESRQDVMAQIMEMAAQGHNAVAGADGAAMPGALAGMDDVQGGGEGDDAAGNAGGGTFGALRGFLDRLWGDAPQTETEGPVDVEEDRAGDATEERDQEVSRQ